MPKYEFSSTVPVVRPRDSSYRSYMLILDMLADGSRSFEELWKLTKLHRNTVSLRLKHLVSEGLVVRTREKHRVLYAVTEPIEIDKWNELSWQIWRELGKRKYLKAVREWMEWEPVPGLRKLENLPDNQELLESQELAEGFPDWEELLLDEYYEMLKINHDLTEKAICPECFHIGTFEDYSTEEIICRTCGYVIEDEPVSLKKRVEAISFLLKVTQEEKRDESILSKKKDNSDDKKDQSN